MGLSVFALGACGFRTFRPQTNQMTSRYSLAFVCCLILVCLTWTPRLHAAAISWDGGGDGISWDDNTNWSGDVLPGGADDVTINVGGTPTILHSTGTTTINSLSCDENLILSGGSLDLAAASTITANGALSLTGGTLTGAGTLTVNSAMTWSSGAMSGTGTTEIAGGATLTISTATAKTLSQRTLSILNTGIANVTGTGQIGLQTSAVIDNQAGGTFDVQVDANIAHTFGAVVTINNAGTFQKSGGTGTTQIGGGIAFNNTGSVKVQMGTLDFAGTFSSFSGTTLTGGTYDVSGICSFPAPTSSRTRPPLSWMVQVH